MFISVTYYCHYIVYHYGPLDKSYTLLLNWTLTVSLIGFTL